MDELTIHERIEVLTVIKLHLRQLGCKQVGVGDASYETLLSAYRKLKQHHITE